MGEVLTAKPQKLKIKLISMKVNTMQNGVKQIIFKRTSTSDALLANIVSDQAQFWA